MTTDFYIGIFLGFGISALGISAAHTFTEWTETKTETVPIESLSSQESRDGFLPAESISSR